MTRARPLALGLLLVALTALPGGRAQAAFPGANGLIAFGRIAGSEINVFVVKPDGSGEKQLTSGSEGNIHPAWSADGKRISFASNRAGGDSDIHVMNADGSAQTRLTTNPGPDGIPSWSPDGTKIVVVRGSPSGVSVMNADGSAQTPLTTPSGTSDVGATRDTQPSFSPDGQKIAFCRQEVKTAPPFSLVQYDIYVNANGSAPTRLTTAGSAFDDGCFGLGWQPLPSQCPDITVGNAVAQGCFKETSQGSGIFGVRAGAETLGTLLTAQRRVVFTATPPTGRLVVTVQAIAPSDRLGPVATVTVAPPSR